MAILMLMCSGITGDGAERCDNFTFRGFANQRLEDVYSEESDEYASGSGGRLGQCAGTWVLSTGGAGGCLGSAVWRSDGPFEPRKYDTRWWENTDGTWHQRNVSVTCIRSETQLRMILLPPGGADISPDLSSAITALSSPEVQYFPSFPSPSLLLIKAFPPQPADVSALPTVVGGIGILYEVIEHTLYPPDYEYPRSPAAVPAADSDDDDSVEIMGPVFVTIGCLVVFLFVVQCVMKWVKVGYEREVRKLPQERDIPPIPMEVLDDLDTPKEAKEAKEMKAHLKPEAAADASQSSESTAKVHLSLRGVSEDGTSESSWTDVPTSVTSDALVPMSETGHTVPKQLTVTSAALGSEPVVYYVQEHGSQPIFMSVIGNDSSATTVAQDGEGHWVINGVLKSLHPQDTGPHAASEWVKLPGAEPEAVNIEVMWSDAPPKLWVIAPSLPEVESTYWYKSEFNGYPVWEGSTWAVYTDAKGHWKIGDLSTGAGYVKSVQPHNGAFPCTIAEWWRSPVRSGEVEWVIDSEILVSKTKIRRRRKSSLNEVALWVDCGKDNAVNSKYCYKATEEDEPQWVASDQRYRMRNDNGHWSVFEGDTSEVVLRSVDPHCGCPPYKTKKWSIKAPFTIASMSVHVGKAPKPLISIAGSHKYKITCTLEALQNVEGTYTRKGTFNEHPLWISARLSIFSDTSGHWKIGSHQDGTGILKSEGEHTSHLPHTVDTWMRSPLTADENTWITLDKGAISLEEV